MWDTAGQEKFKSILTSYYKGTHGILLVYDITNKQSFVDLQLWLSEVEKHGRENVVKILIGNKKDLESQRQVSTEEASKFAESQGMKYLETSAKDGLNIEESFVNLVKEMKKKNFNNILNNTKKPPTLIRDTTKNKRMTCCWVIIILFILFGTDWVWDE